ncbi:MAG: hypothetical protein JNM91_06180 [Flavobacteriales bacterium]|nr:hypothetical protein [Flavobacteriales bacterium]
MRTPLSMIAALGFLSAAAQPFGNYELVLRKLTPVGMPGVQSFAWGQQDGQWFIIGGRTDGLHRRQPPFAFLAADNNVSAYVVDPATWQIWSAGLGALPQGLLEQLQSTNMEFEQRDSTLYCIGGYGYSITAADHITYPNLAAIDLAGVMQAIRDAQPITPFFRQITDPRLEVTGGQLRLLDGKFYLVGGQRFIGRYNPMGPDFGPGFIQEYTNAVRRFSIDDDGVNIGITDYWELVDTVNLHRRDYNMLPQIFPDGLEGLTVFSGVFQYASDVPWLNTVDILDTTISVVPVFEQLLNQYHTAHAGLYQASSNTMRSLFFGGIGRYYFDGNGTLMDDPNVPFVSTISMVQRDAVGMMSESDIGAMPALLGASAEFIPWPATPQTSTGILLQDQFVGDTILLGHIVGGIESSAPNIFFVNTGTQSEASTKVFEVSLVDQSTTVMELSSTARMRVYVDGRTLRVSPGEVLPQGTRLRILDSLGRAVIARNVVLADKSGALDVDLNGIPRGSYVVELRSGVRSLTARFVF